MRSAAPLVIMLCCAALGSVVVAQEERTADGPRRATRGIDPFQRYFVVRGVEFTPEQQAAADKIREKYLPQIQVGQRQWDGVITEEQQQARRAAFDKAREAGKQGQELRQAAEDAIELTPQQQQARAKLRDERSEILKQVQTELLALLTPQQRPAARRRGEQQNRIPPTHADVKYGPHRRNVMDLWLAKSDQPTPVLVSIHGGGFRGGNKSVSPGLLNACLESGISVVAITYRFSSDAIAPASFLDSARAIQTIRHKAKEWNFDPTRIAASGGSAGAGISLWLGFHDDLADPNSTDPVLRESTRLTCMVVSAGQTSYDPRFIRKLIPEADTYKHSALAELYDADLEDLDNLPEEKYRLMEEVSPINHLTKDDPPAMLGYGGSLDQKITNASIGIHHARFGQALKEKMDPLGIRCEVNAGDQVLGGGTRTWHIDFLKQEFKMK